MSITKVVGYGLTIKDVIGTYTNPQVNILMILRDKFVNRCAFGCLIKSVNKIIKAEDCIMVQDGDCGSGNVYVSFEITGIAYRKDEIINGCKIIKIDSKSNTIICSTRDDSAGIILSRHERLESLKAGQLISIRVADARYSLGMKKISINAKPFLAAKNKVYKLSSFDKSAIVPAIKYMAEEEARAAETRSKHAKPWELFGFEMLYAYTSLQTVPKANISAISDLLTAPKPIYVCRDVRLDLREPNVAVWKKAEDVPDDLIIDENIPAAAVMSLLIYDYCDYIRTVREMIEIYNTTELIDDHKNLWLIYKKTKLIPK